MVEIVENLCKKVKFLELPVLTAILTEKPGLP